MSNVHESSPSCLQRFGNLIRRSLLYILLLIIFTASIAAQPLDRAVQLAELLALKNQIYASTYPAQTAILMGTSKANSHLTEIITIGLASP
jgi:hypothetical protein